jgi:hypothetical protein
LRWADPLSKESYPLCIRLRTDAALAPTKSTTNGLETERQRYVRSPYRIQVGRRLTEPDMRARMVYWGTFFGHGVRGSRFRDEESHIHLGGYLNRQTTRFLGFQRPDVVVQEPLRSGHVTIGCAVSAHGILGPCFIEDEEDNAVTVTQERYRDMVGPSHE